ncbi:hypothetical protein [Tissierella praeacuta]|uniref:hypothetical protein n=1 Tax=Tissierella praeacuta TaxID=43131 RepID=UPI00104B3977|nr:hypothetical protein [Tissierella praeacuta]
MRNRTTMNIIKSVLYGFIALIQIGFITIVFIIDNLTRKKAGVMRHIYSRRLQYEQSIYSSSNLFKHSILGVILCILFIVLFIYSIKKKQNPFLRVQLILGLVMSLLVPIVINSNYFISMMSYPYFIMVFELILLIQAIVVASIYLTIVPKD